MGPVLGILLNTEKRGKEWWHGIRGPVLRGFTVLNI